jgi:hypothetical protein
MKTLLALVVCCTFYASGQTTPSTSKHGHEMSTVESRGETAMGFSHAKTTHHFRLYPDGGAIEVTANDPNDTQEVEAVRMHLQHISKMFAAGDFFAPMFIHDRVPPGVPQLQTAKEAVSYRFEQIPSGAKVRIQTPDKQFVNAVHDFLRFQIADHHTGDALTVSSLKFCATRGSISTW